MSQPTFERTLVTAALPYANGPLHIGHIAGAYLPADIYCRYLRLKGSPVLFICGSDEHGVPIMLRARADGVDPRSIVDRYHTHMRDTFEALGMSFDQFGRTSGEANARTSQEFFERLADKDVFVRKTESQLYDPKASMFLADRFVRGTCPSCGYDDAYGDQCEKCGRSLSPAELKNPRSAISDATPELRETTHWYLPLGKLQPELEAWLGKHADWKSNVLGQVRSWLTEGLVDRPVTRDLSWGIPVPQRVADAAGVDVAGKVLYVWFDAPIGYISFTREWAERKGDPEGWKTWWQRESTRLIHFIGKDNIVFHCLIFPAMLQAHGEYVLPDNVPANEFLNLEGKKLSTSRGWAVWLHEALEAFPADYLRYSLARTLPETKDADFSWKDFQAHINNELADTLGNLVNRSLSFAVKNFDGKVPELADPSDADQAMLAEIGAFPPRIGEHLEAFRFRDALGEAMTLARIGNKYFNDAEPWATRKTNLRACGNTIHVAMQLCASLSILMDPFVPFMAQQMRVMLGMEGVRASGVVANAGASIGWDESARSLLPAGHSLGKPDILVRKIEDDAVEAQRAKLVSATEAQPAAAKPFKPLADNIEFDTFAAADMRVGKILVCEPIKKSKKLLRCEVDLGFEKRQVLAGVAEHFKPEDLLGRKVIVVANLAPRIMMGLESQGMMLMATDREGHLAPLFADSEPGAKVS